MLITVKNKIRAGTIFLFSLLLILGGIGIYYLVQLKEDARSILTNNYETIDYCHNMMGSLDSIGIDRNSSAASFFLNLERQEKNITEPGEGNSTKQLRQNAEKIFAGDNSQSTNLSARKEIQQILELNMTAIEAKNRKAGVTADRAMSYLTIIATIIFLIAVTFSYNFPFILTGPFRKLTEGIGQIEKKNYSHRIHMEQEDEFGQLANSFNSMAARLEYFENSNLNRIMFEKSRAEAVINSLKDASIGIDKSDKVLFANNQALQLLGMSGEEIVGQSINEVMQKNDLFRFLMTEKTPSPFKIVVDNRENYFTREIIDINQKDGAGNKVIILKNITSFKELDVAKTNFIATISHELKTPLASSDFGLKLLEDSRVGNLSEEQKNIVQHLREDNQRMLKILSELLNMSQVEAGKIEMHPEPVEPEQIVERAVATIQSAAEEKHISVEIRTSEKIPLVLADKEKVGWVLNNFLTNAIKFSPLNGTIVIDVETIEDQVIFSVSDNGSGIEEKFLDKIFSRYFKVPGNISAGNGLGLAISKDFIEAMNGRVSAQSVYGEGSTFSFSLPSIHS